MPKWNVELPDAHWLDPAQPDDMPAIHRLVEELNRIVLIAIDTETTGLDKMRDLPLFWSLAWEDDNLKQKRVCMPATSLKYFTEVFGDPHRQWIFANAKYDLAILANVGTEVAGEIFDVIVMHSMLYEEMPHDLKSMADHVLGYRWNDFKDTFQFNRAGKLTSKSSREEVAAGGSFQTVQDAILWCHKNDLAKLIEYATNDAWGTYAIYKELLRRLREAPTESCLWPTPQWIDDAFKTVADLYFNVEAPFTRVLFECERAGVLLDQEYLKSLDRPMTDDMNALARKVTHLTAPTGSPILNINSNQELAHYLYTVMNYKVTKMTKGGKKGIRSPSVDHATLERLEEDHPEDGVLSLKMQHGKIKKLHSTYVVGMLEQVQPSGRIHTNYNQHVAVTGRLSSSEPNLQNIVRPDEDKEADLYNIRRAFVAPPGKTLICADFSQLEMRLLAIMAGEQDMLDIFLRGHDIHMGNASLVFDLPYDDIKRAKKMKEEEWAALPKDQVDYFHRCLRARQDAKTIGFGLNYGMQKQTLSKRLGCSEAEAQQKIDAYMARYPAVKHYFDTAIGTAQETGFVFTVLGRRRYLPDITSTDRELRSRAERQASNLPIQGAAADVVKMAMIRCREAQLKERFGCIMMLQVHDELLFECPVEHAEQASTVIRNCMEHSFPEDFAIPLSISLGTASNWSEAK